MLDDPSGPPECGVLTTSREPIGIDGETVWTLEPLGVPSDDDSPVRARAAPAIELFLQRMDAVAPAMEIDDEVLARAAEICVAVDGLPLPIELAAARALSHALGDIAVQVAADPSRLSRINRGPRDHRARFARRSSGAISCSARRSSLLTADYPFSPGSSRPIWPAPCGRYGRRRCRRRR